MFERGELAHAEPSWRRALNVLAIWLPIWLGPVALLWALTGIAERLDAARRLLQHDGGRHLRRRLCGARLCRAGGRRRLMAGSRPARWSTGSASPRRRRGRSSWCCSSSASSPPIARRARSIRCSPGCLGALLTTWVTFAPCFLWIFLGAPYVEALRGNKAISAALSRDHRRGGRRDPEPRALVRAACRLPRGAAGSSSSASARICRSCPRSTGGRRCSRQRR